jgi:hypothetical protein
MYRRILTLLLVCLLLPIFGYASGGDVLETFGLMLLVIVIFILVLVFVDLNRNGKIFLAMLFLIADGITLILTDDMPYRDNKAIINILTAAIPLGTLLISYFALKLKFRKVSR